MEALSGSQRRAPTLPPDARFFPDASQIVGWCGGQFIRDAAFPPNSTFFSAFSRELTPDVIAHLHRNEAVPHIPHSPVPSLRYLSPMLHPRQAKLLLVLKTASVRFDLEPINKSE